MPIQVIIKRKWQIDEPEALIPLLTELRSLAKKQPGYISGETLMQSDYPENMAVIATWQSMEAWNAWKNSEERGKYEAMLEIYQTRPTQYEEYILGTSVQNNA